MAAGAQVTAWRPAVSGVTEVFHARFVDHVYPMHTHEAWTLLLIDAGAVRYDLDGHEHAALDSEVTLLPPHVPHDGQAATPYGFRKRVLYLEPALLGEDLISAAVDRLHPDARGQPGPVRPLSLVMPAAPPARSGGVAVGEVEDPAPGVGAGVLPSRERAVEERVPSATDVNPPIVPASGRSLAAGYRYGRPRTLLTPCCAFMTGCLSISGRDYRCGGVDAR